MKNKLKQNQGVTLVALVVTIIVLVILATVSISMVLGNQGIFTQAEDAKSLTANAQIAEEEGFNQIYEQLAGYINGGSTTPEPPKTDMPKIDVDKPAIEDSTIDGNKGTYNNPIIPKGFKAINQAPAIWTETTGYMNGLVIEDATSDATTKGSQFVWVPVKDYEKFYLREGYYNGSLQMYLAQLSDPFREAGASKTELLPGKPKTTNTVLGTDESVAIYKSVKDNGGFYIARFEAGINGTTTSTIINDSNKKIQDGTVKPVSKAKVGVWNFIPWGEDSSGEATDHLAGNDNANGAVKVARSMYKENTETTVKSTLCYGVQWDAVIQFIDPDYKDYAKDSTGKGNYTGKIAVTGDNVNYVQKNIFDMAGNIFEWTMESSSKYSRVFRGGYYEGAGSVFTSSSRYNDSPGYSENRVGFRTVIYM